jgi:hypothetical protein
LPAAPTSFRKRRDRIFEVIGFLVVAMQVTEGVINTALQLALREGDAVTLESLTKDQERFRKATLGRLIKAIKERSSISSDFDQVLEAYLKDRNTLIHDLGRMGGFDYKSKEGLDRMERFVWNLNQNYEVVTKVFMSLLWEWSDQVGMNDGMDRERVKRALGDLDGIAGHVFYRKL